jgi:hypothetical protein
MKFNKWTLGLAAVGAVSMASAVRADEAPKLVPLNTALSSTVISGYVDVAAQYDTGDYGPYGSVPVGYTAGAGSPAKIDSIALNSFDIALDKAEDESPWAAGYHAEVNAGTEAVGVSLNSSAAYNLAIRQAYIVFRTPVGNGIDWKLGVQDDIIGYEGNTDGGNPNYTRSYGYSLEPTTLVGLIGSYKIVDAVTVQAGIANADTANPFGYGGVNTSSDKTLAGAIAFTAPDSFGWAKGATLNLGTLLNIDKGGQDNFYAGLTVPTPVSALSLGAAFDLVSVNNASVDNSKNDSGWTLGLYGVVKATDKLQFSLRGEYFDLEGSPSSAGAIYPYSDGTPSTDGRGEEVTATLQYNLWANVISRLEVRWDHIDSGTYFANNYGDANAFLLAANFIYTF